jgi:hypothetical protein
MKLGTTMPQRYQALTTDNGRGNLSGALEQVTKQGRKTKTARAGEADRTSIMGPLIMKIQHRC